MAQARSGRTHAISKAKPEREVKIGILAVQGDFEAHAAMLQQLGAQTAEVRTPADLDGCDGLILPGGESTTQLKFLLEEGLADKIVKFAERGGAIFGTCAGAILLANDVQHPRQDSLNLMDMTVVRNAYGRQIASDVVSGPTTLKRSEERRVGKECRSGRTADHQKKKRRSVSDVGKRSKEDVR